MHGMTSGAGVDWNDTLLQPTSSQKCTGAFATIIAGEEYASLALCLHRQLRLYASKCTLLVVYSDVDADRAISRGTLQRISEEIGHENLIALSSLVHRAQRHPAIAWPIPGTAIEVHRDSDNVTGLLKWTNAAQWGAGRLVYGVHKYWLWALDPERYPRVAYLDVDVLVMRNLDRLLHAEFSHDIAAVTSAPICQLKSFNSGLLVLKPNLRTLVRLLLGHRFVNFPWKGRVPEFDDARLSLSGPLTLKKQQRVVGAPTLVIGWAEHCLPPGCNTASCAPADTLANAKLAAVLRPNQTGFLSKCRTLHGGKYKRGALVQKSCERHAFDQSVLNWHFAGRWFNLPKLYNVQSQLWELMATKGKIEEHSIAMIHFAGDLKPWGDARSLSLYGSGRLKLPQSSKVWTPQFRILAERWRAACPAEVIAAASRGSHV